MTRAKLTVEAARIALEAIIRTQLQEVYSRGVDASPHGVNALADPQAKEAFKAISQAAEDYTSTCLTLFSERVRAAQERAQP